MNNTRTSGLPPSLPPLVISSRDLSRLEALLDTPVLRRHPAALALMDELNRADVRAPDQMQLDLLATYNASRGQVFRLLRLPAWLRLFRLASLGTMLVTLRPSPNCSRRGVEAISQFWATLKF